MNAAAPMVIDHDTQAIAETPAKTGQIIKTDSAKVLEVLLKVAKDPDVDIDRLGQVQAFYERLKAQDAESAYDEAMAAAQAEMGPIAADANNPQTKSRYASYAALDRALRPIYTKHGFSLSFSSGDGAPPDHVRVVCKVACAGHKTFPHLDMPADGKGAKGGDVMTKTHATGAAFTYGQRYLLKMVFNIAVGDDDDGNAAGSAAYAQVITSTQLAELVALVDEVGADREKFLNFLRVDGLSDLPARRFNEAKRALEAKRVRS
jgi:hypothetical protein